MDAPLFSFPRSPSNTDLLQLDFKSGALFDESRVSREAQPRLHAFSHANATHILSCHNLSGQDAKIAWMSVH